MKQYYVYMMFNLARTLYVGVTNDLERRVYEHKQGIVEGFTKRYHLTMLVHYEETDDVGVAITREKQIKGWLRSKKVALVESENPQWKDLSEGWYGADTAQSATGRRETDSSVVTLPQNDMRRIVLQEV